MGIFSKRRGEPAAESGLTEEQAANRRAIEGAESAFISEFKQWIERVDQAQVASGCGEFTDEVLGRVGPFPPVGSTDLSRMQIVHMRAYARAFANAQIRGRRATRIVAADRGDGSTVLDVSNYWDGVEGYVQSVVG